MRCQYTHFTEGETETQRNYWASHTVQIQTQDELSEAALMNTMHGRIISV